MAKKKPKGRGKKPPAPAGKIDYGAPEQLAKYDAETARILNELREESQEIGNRYRNAKQITADLKKEWEVSQVKIGEMIDDRKKYRGHGPKPVQASILDLPRTTEAEPAAALPAAAPDAPRWFPEDLWKKYPVADWPGLKPADIEAMKAGKAKKGDSFRPIILVGDIEQFTTPNPSSDFRRTWIDIHGLGEAAASRIEAAELEFWKQWNAGGDAAFAMKSGYQPDNKVNDASEPGSGSEDSPASDSAPAGGQSSKPGKRKPAKKLRGGTNGKPIKFRKPKPSGSAEEREAKAAAESGAPEGSEVPE